MIFTLASHVQAWMVEAQQEEEDRRLIPTEEEKQETVGAQQDGTDGDHDRSLTSRYSRL